MLVVEGQGLPIGVHLASARPHELKLAQPTMRTIKVPRAQGRPRVRPDELVADKGYDSREFREWLRKRGIKPTIPPNARRRKRPKPGRPRVTGLSYHQRWLVERTFAWLGTFRRIVVRHERKVEVFRAFVLLAFILICLRYF